jgi:hypothetical protein
MRRQTEFITQLRRIFAWTVREKLDYVGRSASASVLRRAEASDLNLLRASTNVNVLQESKQEQRTSPTSSEPRSRGRRRRRSLLTPTTTTFPQYDLTFRSSHTLVVIVVRSSVQPATAPMVHKSAVNAFPQSQRSYSRRTSPSSRSATLCCQPHLP